MFGFDRTLILAIIMKMLKRPEKMARSRPPFNTIRFLLHIKKNLFIYCKKHIDRLSININTYFVPIHIRDRYQIEQKTKTKNICIIIIYM